MSNFEVLQFSIKGTRPLIMHSDKLANPLDPETKKYKQLTSVRKKTDEQLEQIAISEWRASLYYDDRLGPIMPSENIEACLVEGAKFSKLGTAFKRGIMVMDLVYKFDYQLENSNTGKLKDGPRDIDAMQGITDIQYTKSVVVSRSRIMRCRPRFKEWSISNINLQYNPEICDVEQIKKALTDAGEMVGLCDWRPKYGRFDVEFND